MHQSTFYAILAVLASAHAVPMTEEFRVHRRECLIVGGCGPTSALQTPIVEPLIARQNFFEPEPSMEEPGFVAPQKARSEPLEVDGGASIDLVNGEKRMCAGDGCGLPVEPLSTPLSTEIIAREPADKRMCAADGCNLPIEPLSTPLSTEIIARDSADKRMCAGDGCDLPIEPLDKRIAICRLAADGTTESGCGVEPVETPISLPKRPLRTEAKRIVCPLAADGTVSSECSGPIIEPITTPVSLPVKQKAGKAAASFTAVIRPRPAARTAIPMKPRLMPLEVAGEAPIQPAEQLSLNANANGKRSSTLEYNLNGGAVTAHTDANGNPVVHVVGSIPTLTTRVVKPKQMSGAATVAAKGVVPAAAATASVAV